MNPYKFTHLIAAVLADALDVEKYDEIADLLTQREFGTLNAKLLVASGKLDVRYWICAFSVNQHAGICGSPPPTDSTGHAIAPCHCSTPKHFDGDLSAARLHSAGSSTAMSCLALMIPCDESGGQVAGSSACLL